MEKLDLAKVYKAYYSAAVKPALKDIGPAQYISITGKGDPSGKEFGDNIQLLYAVAYALKFMCKTDGNDFTVPKLEALWDFDHKKYSGISMIDAPAKVPRSEWTYRLMIRLPEYVRQKQIASAIRQVIIKKKLEQAEKVEYYKMNEGKVVDMLHIGPFDKEMETLVHIQAFTEANNLKKNGQHHEIYLSDFRKTIPEKLKTILREPVK